MSLASIGRATVAVVKDWVAVKYCNTSEYHYSCFSPIKCALLECIPLPGRDRQVYCSSLYNTCWTSFGCRLILLDIYLQGLHHSGCTQIGYCHYISTGSSSALPLQEIKMQQHQRHKWYIEYTLHFNYFVLIPEKFSEEIIRTLQLRDAVFSHIVCASLQDIRRFAVIFTEIMSMFIGYSSKSQQNLC